MTRASEFAGWRPRVLVTAPLRGEGLDRLRQMADVVYDPWIDQHPLRMYNSAQLAERLAEEGADALIVESDLVGPEVFKAGVRFVAATRADPVNVEIAAATDALVPVVRCPGRNADAVAELAVALLFALARRVLPADDDVRAGQVYRDGTIPYQRFRAWELNGRTAGLVGLGAVGRATKWRLEGLGLRVVAYDPYATEETVSLEELLEVSDVVSMHAPVTPETTGMIGAPQFTAMREGAFYLNTARAKLHDTDALVDALRSGHLAGAGLDHFEGEHLPADHPLVSMSNVVLTPHIGGATWDTECRQATIVADGLARLLAGEVPAFIVNPEVMQ
ncbi:MAG TPA: NAD(P)-dependent oxidoreductase [Acidimicrobiales bacterium]|nr:NAD(P)-dependent oxidoreductase [Acidimicrobiales bacterium]